MSYTCKRCGYYTEYKGNLKNHLNRKRPCKPIKSNISFETLKKEFSNLINNPIISLNSSSNFLNFSLDFPQKTSILPQISSKMISEKFVCEYCEKTFSRKDNLERHQTTCKKKKLIKETLVDQIQQMKEEQEKKIQEMKEEQNNRIQEMKEEHAIEKEALRKEIEKLLEKVGINNSNNKCYNIKNQTIMINSFGKENLDYITSELLQKLLKGPYSAVPKLIKNIHFHPKHPENHNVKITNKKLPYASVWDKDKWLIKDKRDVIESMVDKSFNLLDEQLEDNPACIETEKKITFTKIQDKYEENDKDTHKLFQKQAELILLNGNITMEDQAP